MNYGKTAYLKVLDLEKELTQKQTEDSQNSYIEISKPNINQLITDESSIEIKLPLISVESEKTICFQIKATFTSLSNCEINSCLVINQTVLNEENKILPVGESDFVILKTFTPLTNGNIEPIIKFSTTSEQAQTSLKSMKIIILGAKGDSINTDIEMRGLYIENQNKSLISYIDDNKLYYSFESLEEKTLQSKNFTLLNSAISHCFCLDSFASGDDSPDIVLYRVDTSKKLYHSKPFISNIETLIDSDVSVVYACPSPKNSDENNTVVYIKNGDCYYVSSKWNSFSTPKKLSLPSGKYVDIHAVSHPENDYLYIFASHENGSNYILRSTMAVSTGKIIESLQMSYETLVTKYIDVSILTDNAIENLTLNVETIIDSFINYESIFNRVSLSTLNLSCEFDASAYKIEFNGIYGVKLDRNILTAGKWESYTDDAVNFEGAYMDFENDKFVDNGWLNRWPFNEIRPCLIKDGNIIGYLDPNNYTIFEDGTSANIYDNTYGEVMIEIPKIYYKLSTDDNFIYVQISKKAREGFTDRAFWHSGHDNEKIYVGAYLSGDSYMTTKGLYSNSNCSLNNYYTVSYSNFYPYKQKYNNPNMEFMPFNVLTLLQCLYIIMFKNTDSKNSLGYGMGSVQTNYTTGTANNKGMYYGQNSTMTPIKCFGIEDIYGTRQVVVSGFYIDSNGAPRFIDVYDPNSSYDPSAVSNYKSLETTLNLGTLRTGVLTTITGYNELGFMDKVDYKVSDATLGFTDHCFTTKSTNCVIHGLIRTDEGYGIFNSKTAKPDAFDQKWSFRLVYYPNLNT